MHTAGTKAVAVKDSKGLMIGLNICFDSCYPFIIRETAALPGVNVIALPTIDPDSRHSFIAGMHAAFTPFRSAENGVAMVRADGHFGSMIVNERGRIVAELHNEQSGWTGFISGKRVWTPYQVIGDSFWYLCIVGTLAYPFGLVLKAAKKRREMALEEAKASK